MPGCRATGCSARHGEKGGSGGCAGGGDGGSIRTQSVTLAMCIASPPRTANLLCVDTGPKSVCCVLPSSVVATVSEPVNLIVAVIRPLEPQVCCTIFIRDESYV